MSIERRSKFWGAQAASLPFAAACREHLAALNRMRAADLVNAPLNPSGKLPDGAGWQPALPSSGNPRPKA
jgi:hypothetical protein